MKVFHIADLHFGKSLAGMSLLEDQRDWTGKFIALVREEKPSAVIIAGDVYDRGAPGDDAVALLDEFLTRLVESDESLHVLIVSGNHDSGRKLAFGASILKKQRVHIVGQARADIDCVSLEDEFGPVKFWLLPYTFPAAVQQILGDETPRDYTGALQALLSRQQINTAERNVLVAHQSVLLPDGKEVEKGGSETMIGGVGGIDGSVFSDFDYVALGHVHKAQPVGRETMRYAGSPLCYHFDETKWNRKGAVCVSLNAKGDVKVEQKEIAPLHPLRVVEGAFDEIIERETARTTGGEYVKVVLTDRRLNPADADTLRALFAAKGRIALELQSSFSEFKSAASGDEAPAPEIPLKEKFLQFWKARHDTDAEPDEETLALIEFVSGQAETQDGSVEEDADKIIKFATEGK